LGPVQPGLVKSGSGKPGAADCRYRVRFAGKPECFVSLKQAAQDRERNEPRMRG
jgi:hypothetical protein